MDKDKKTLLNISIVVILIYIFFNPPTLYLSAISAHRSSERSANYGPSEIKYTESFNGGKYFLGQYDKWVSCNTSNRTLFLFWTFGNQVHGFENDISKAVDYSGSLSQEKIMFYGIINDDNIDRIEIIMSDGIKLNQDEFHDQLFLVTDKKGSSAFNFTLKAYDKDNNLIYEDIH